MSRALAEIASYHAHVYFDPGHDRAEAKALRTAMQQRHGMRSPEYAKADRALGVLWRQIKELKAAIAGPPAA